jgi:hypothetical protein
MREVLDKVTPELLTPLFRDFFHELRRSKELEPYRVLKGFYVASVDGSGYFSSEKLHCPGCLVKKKRYEHQIVQAVLVHPGKRQVIPLCPEEVRNTDGAGKQDCEITAGKRVIRRLRRDHELPLLCTPQQGEENLPQRLGDRLSHRRKERRGTCENRPLGEKHLSFNFFLLNLFAFSMHQIFELTDRLYQACRVKPGSKRNLRDHLRVSMRMLIFPDWEILLKRVHTPSDFW